MGRGETNAKKRKRNSEAKGNSNGSSAPVDTSKPTAIFKPRTGRDWTVSIALPGSIIANAQTHELRTSLAGQIARAASVFCVDEVVVFSDATSKQQPRKHNRAETQAQHHTDGSHEEYTGTSDPDHFLVHLLSYLETPPHLRKLLFPLHANLRTAGTLPSLDLPHHLRADEWLPYREGVTIIPSESQSPPPGHTLVEAGLRIPVTVNAEIPPSTRVTLKFDPDAEAASKSQRATEIRAEAVNPDEPREESGYYWGYNVRRAESLSDVIQECTYEGGYDFIIGTSERGVDLEALYGTTNKADQAEERDGGSEGKGANGFNNGKESLKVPSFKRLLITFGGPSGLEAAVKNDLAMHALGIKDASQPFDRWVNLCPGQGSRTIRTEEAVWIGLMGLRRAVEGNYKR